MEINNPYSILVNRYIQVLSILRPNLVPIKAESSENLARLSLEHSLWMLHKMSEPDYKPLTSFGNWISWIQSSLYLHRLIDPTHEIDITREISKQYRVKIV